MEATVSYSLMLQKNHLKSKDSEIKNYELCLVNILKDFTINNRKKRNKTKQYYKELHFCSVNFNPNDNNDILDIHRYLMKVKWYKIMFQLLKMFIVLLSNIVNGSYHTKSTS